MAKKKENNITSSFADGREQAIRIGLFGASGTGKTYRANQLAQTCRRLIIFDPLGEFARGEGAQVYDNLRSLSAAIRNNWRKGFRFVFLPTWGNEEKALAALSRVIINLQTPYNMGASNTKITLLVDELDLSFPCFARMRDRTTPFGFLCNRGRHYGVNLIGISQRPAQVDICFRANLSSVYFFRLAEPADFDAAIKMLGRDWTGVLRSLKDRQYIYKNGGFTCLK